MAEVHWYEAHGIGMKVMKIKRFLGLTIMNHKRRYVVCINNEDYEVDLELRKIYLVISDAKAEALGFFRIMDESGEDYLYPRSFFLPISVPKTIQKALARAS